jgi:hypothetical protein
MRRALVIAVLCFGCGACETYGSDLRPVLDRFEIPQEWVLVALREGGLGSRFAASPPPYTTRFYSAPWNGGGICEQLFGLAAQVGTPAEVKGNTCAVQVRVRTGWRGQNRVRIHLVAIAPEKVGIYLTAAACQRSREASEAMQGSLWNRSPECWVPEGMALVEIEAQAHM